MLNVLIPSLESLPYILLQAVAAIICIFIAVRAASQAQREVARARPFAIMAACAAFWMTVAFMESLSNTLAWKEVWWRLIPLGISNTVLALFYFTLQYCLRLKKTPPALLLLSITITLVILAAAITNHLHQLWWTVKPVQDYFIQVYGPLFFAQLYYTYLLVVICLIAMVRTFFSSTGMLRVQTGFMILGIFIPVSVSVAADIYAWNPLPFIDEPAFSMVFTVVIFAWATFRFNVFYLLPVAYETIIKNMQDGVLVTDNDGHILFSNPSANLALGKSGAQISGQSVAKILGDWLPEAFHAWEKGQPDIQLTSSQPKNMFFRLTISQFSNPSGESIGNLLTIYNNSEQKNLENRLHEMAISDPLTGCYNRRYFYEIAQNYFNQVQRSGRPLSIMMIDLDHFKKVNDTYGHIKGDQALQAVANCCKTHIRVGDILTRYGGEEFVIAMPDTDLANAADAAERLRQAIETQSKEKTGVSITASIGIAETRGGLETTFEAVLDHADEAMYRSKQAGRNRVTIWSDV